MSTDRELLEMAAKAAGIKVPTKEDYPYAYIDQHGIHRDISCGGDGSRMSHWNPLTDDVDALRLAVKLRLNINFEEWDGAEYACAVPSKSHQGHDEVMGDDDGAATRRAIVRAAAEIGKAMV
jgi:hypothetical protein